MTKILTERTHSSTLEMITEAIDKSKSPNVLGRLKGIAAEADKPTRNGRTYSSKLWENVINSDVFKEYLETKTLYGELNHPSDRLETDIREIAISLSAIEKDSKGNVIGTFDILDTPNGRILKTLCEYGSKLGVSSRGGGEVISRGGVDYVDEDSFEFVAFDVVTLPAVKSARPKVIESTELKITPIKEKILEEVNNTEDNITLKSIKRLVESLDIDKSEDIINLIDEKIENKEPDLNIQLFESKIQEATSDKELKLLVDLMQSFKTDEFNKLKESALNKLNSMEGDTDTSRLLEDLKDSINTINSLESKVVDLQKEISAGTTREAELEESLEKARQATKQLSEKAKTVDNYKKLLETAQANSKEKELITENSKLTSRLDLITEKYNQVRKDLIKSKTILETQEQRYDSLLQESERLSKNYKSHLESLTKDFKIKETKLIEKSNKIFSNYQAKSKETKILAERFIKEYAKYNSLDANDIINRLDENFSVTDVDTLLERALDYKKRIKSLPFNVSDEINAEIIVEQKKKTPQINNPDDDDLSGMLGLLDHIVKG